MILYRKHFCAATTAVLILSLADASFAADNDSAKSAEPKAKGYDESFQTGDIPKPNAPDLDPDVVHEDEATPDTSPDSNPENDPNLDRTPAEYRYGVAASLALPHLVNLSLEGMFQDKFGISFNWGNVTRSLANVDVAMRHQDIRLKWFPMSSSFFVGVALGQHQLTGELYRDIKETTTNQTISTNGKLVASANYVAPHVGWFSVWDSGFTMGCDFGWLVPSGVSTSFTSSFGSLPSGVTAETLEATNEYKEMKKDLEDSAKKYASTPVPFATLIRIGWMF
jgi:hypothetical protein